MNLQVPRPTLTAEDLLSMPDGDSYELVDGRLVEMPVGAESSYLGGEFACLLRNHCRNPFLGWVFPPDTSYQMLPDRPNVVRRPDASFVRAGRFPGEKLPRGHIRLAPDLAVEVVSPNDLHYEVAEKMAEYRKAGIPLVWLVTPPTRTVLIRRIDGTLAEVGEDGELSGEDVVPGFRCSVAELFRLPPGAGEPAASAPDS